MIKRIEFLCSEDGDWIGMYIDGILMKENHSLSEILVAKTIGIAVGFDVVVGEASQEWFDEHGGSCPPILPEELELN